MKCPVCNTEMELTQVSVSFGKNGKEYEKKAFNCKNDDVWIVIEIPKKMLA